MLLSMIPLSRQLPCEGSTCRAVSILSARGVSGIRCAVSSDLRHAQESPTRFNKQKHGQLVRRPLLVRPKGSSGCSLKVASVRQQPACSPLHPAVRATRAAGVPAARSCSTEGSRRRCAQSDSSCVVRCANCGTNDTATPLMRRSPAYARTLCNACGIMLASKGVLPPSVRRIRGQLRTTAPPSSMGSQLTFVVSMNCVRREAGSRQ
jgi:GATA zinc finger